MNIIKIRNLIVTPTLKNIVQKFHLILDQSISSLDYNIRHFFCSFSYSQTYQYESQLSVYDVTKTALWLEHGRLYKK